MIIKKIRFFRKLIITVPIIVFFCFVYFIIVPYVNDYDTSEKLNSIYSRLNLPTNQEECHIPDLPAFTPEMMKFVKNLPPLNCGNENDDWVSCKLSMCSVKESVIAAKGQVLCNFMELIRVSEYLNDYEQTFKSIFHVLKYSDFARVYCWSTNTHDSWTGIVYGIRSNLTKVTTPKNSTPQKMNILMYGLDSMSRNAFIRKLPNSLKYLTEVLGGEVLKGYNIVGDGTPQALIPILTGFSELELPETRKRYPFSEYVDVYPMIWKLYKKHGYTTAWNEDLPNVGTFTYRLKGFSSQPTDHYLRTYYIEQQQYISNYKHYCLGNKRAHNVMLDYTKQILTNQIEIPKFIFSFHGEMSHDSINQVGLMDDDLKDWLQDLNNLDLLNNTLLILMSDHGNRFDTVRNTTQGKLEERLPFFSFVFPKWFKIKYAKEYKHFQNNINRLTTPFDIHATFQHLLALQTGEKFVSRSERAISLLNEIGASRSCRDAFIEPHWCSCLLWKEIDVSLAQDAAQYLVKYLNNITASNRDRCEKLALHVINWAAVLKPQDSMMLFKSSKDLDGYMPGFSTASKSDIQLYQIKITVVPGNSIFEASITYILSTRTYSVDQSAISRINVYGNQARCIYDYNPELRKYCYCKD